MTETHQVEFRKSGIVAAIPDGENLLAFAEEQGVAIPSLCRGGSCGTCRVRLVSGDVNLETVKALTKSQRYQGWILACSSTVHEDIVLDV